MGALKVKTVKRIHCGWLFYRIFFVSTSILFLSGINLNSSPLTDDFKDLKGENGAQSTFTFLTLPVSANQLSRSMSAWMPTNDASTLPFAPSAAAFFSCNQLSATHLEWVMGLRKDYVGATIALFDQGTIGFHSTLFTLGPFENIRTFDEFPQAPPRAGEGTIGISYSRQILNERLGAGINCSFVESYLDQSEARSVNFSVDGLYQPIPWLFCHAYMLNLGPKVKYSTIDEEQPLQAGIAFRVVSTQNEDTLKKRRLAYSFAIGSQKRIYAPLTLGITGEIEPLLPLVLRAGYEYKYGISPGVAGLSAGIGFEVKRYGFDLGWKYQSAVFGSVWSLTTTYRTDPVLPKNAYEYLVVAQRFFNQENFKKTISYAKKALEKDPSLWQALALVKNANARLHQEAGNEVAIIYTGNTQGAFLSATSENGFLGGAARQATMIRRLGSENPAHFLIDAGNMIDSSATIEKYQFVNTFYSTLRYDAVGVGSDEKKLVALYGTGGEADNYIVRICTANDCGTGSFFPWKILTYNKISVAVLCMPGQTGATRENKGNLGADQLTELVRVTQSDQVISANLRILIANGAWEEIERIATTVPNIDCIIAGNQEQPFEIPMKIAGKPVIATGSRGKFVGLLRVRFTPDSGVSGMENRLYALDETVLPDPSIQTMARSVCSSTELSNQTVVSNDGSISPEEGVFAFITDRRGVANISIKTMKKKMEYPCTAEKKPVYQPLLSQKHGMIFYRTVNEKQTGYQAKSVDCTGGNQQNYDFPGSVKEICLSPDESALFACVNLNTSNSAIYRVPLPGGDPVKVLSWADTSLAELSVSYDNTSMVFRGLRNGRYQVFIADRSGITVTQVTTGRGNNTSPQFSPDNRLIIFCSDRNSFGGKRDLWVYERGTGVEEQLTNQTGIASYCWLDPNGTLLYSAGENLTELNTINVYSQENKKLLITGEIKNYSESDPQIFTWKETKYILYVKEYISGDRKIFISRIDGSSDTQITMERGNNWLR